MLYLNLQFSGFKRFYTSFKEKDKNCGSCWTKMFPHRFALPARHNQLLWTCKTSVSLKSPLTDICTQGLALDKFVRKRSETQSVQLVFSLYLQKLLRDIKLFRHRTGSFDHITWWHVPDCRDSWINTCCAVLNPLWSHSHSQCSWF